jgi:hypothetical protein
VLGIWTTNMSSLINEDIREHYERRTLQTDVPAPNDTSCGQLMPFPEDTGGGANNGSHDDLLFGRDVWTPLIISGSSGK